MSIASWMCSELGGDFGDWSDSEGNVVDANDRFLFAIGCGGSTLFPTSTVELTAASRRVLCVSMEGMFEIWDDPTLKSFRKALRGRNHDLLEPITWEDFCDKDVRAFLEGVDMVLLLAGNYSKAPFAAHCEAAGPLVNWVKAGGTFVVHQPECEPLCSDFASMFQKTWSPKGYTRAVHTRNPGAEHAALFMSMDDSVSVKATLFECVPPREALYVADSEPGLIAYACGSFGAGRVAFLGDVNWETPTLSAVAALADAARASPGSQVSALGSASGGSGSGSGSGPAGSGGSGGVGGSGLPPPPPLPQPGPRKKFYGVRIGRVPGVYHDPGEAQEQCKGVPGALMQGFYSRADAVAFVGAVGAPGRGGREGNYCYYAVRVGVKPGVYRTNAEAQVQVQRVPGAQYKGFHNLAEAEAFVKGGKSVPAAAPGKRPREEEQEQRAKHKQRR